MYKIKIHPENCAESSYEFMSKITILIGENKDIAKFLSKKIRLKGFLSRETGFANIIRVNHALRMLLFGDTELMLNLRFAETDQTYFGAYLSIVETQNSVIWKNIKKPKNENIPFVLDFPVDEDLPEKIPTFHFEFDKEEYYLAIRRFINDLEDMCYPDDLYVFASNIIDYKLENRKKQLYEAQRYLLDRLLSEEQDYLLEKHLQTEEPNYQIDDLLRPKRKNDRRRLNK